MDLGNLALSLPVPPDVRTCIEWAQRAEALDYESVWISETAGPDPFVLAAAIAQATSRVRIGIGVSPVYVRTAATIASAASTVAQLAPGRFVLGLGASSHAVVGRWHGEPFERPLTRVRETVEVVRAMLHGHKLFYEGRSLRTHGFQLAIQPPIPVPIYVGALRPAMLEVAGEVGDGVVVNLFPAEILPRMLEHVGLGARRKGKDPRGLEVVCRHTVLVTDDRDAAREALRRALTWYFATPAYNSFAAWYGFAEEAALLAEGFRLGDRDMTRRGMSDRFVDSIAIYGSLDECRERIASYVAEGVNTSAISSLSSDPDAIRSVIEGLAPG
jgi:probable F420-dependent oxidoreductase